MITVIHALIHTLIHTLIYKLTATLDINPWFHFTLNLLE